MCMLSWKGVIRHFRCALAAKGTYMWFPLENTACVVTTYVLRRVVANKKTNLKFLEHSLISSQSEINLEETNIMFNVYMCPCHAHTCVLVTRH